MNATTTEKTKRARKVKLPTADEVVQAIRARGSDTNNLRDAAHEAHHAIETKVPNGKWDRDTISKAVKRLGPGFAAASEIAARAVEQVVCERLGVACAPLPERVLTACMEAMKFREPFMDYDTAHRLVESRLKTDEVQRDADAILALVGKKDGK